MGSRLGTILRIDPGVALPAEAGSKARGLERLARAGLPVPRSWVILPEVASAELRVFAEDLRHRALGPFAVRSSTVDEDGADASFAGVHLSLLGVSTEDLEAGVRRVADSPRSSLARAYRRSMGLPPASGRGAVVVQPLLRAEASGVAFDVGRDGGRVLVESLRARAHGGGARPAGPETVALELEGNGWQIRWRRQGSPSPGAEALADSTCAEIAAGVSVLRAVEGAAVDVEWVLAEGVVSFVQVRPQTRPLGSGLPPRERWTRANLGETFPEIPSAFTRSLLPRVSGAGMRRMLKAFGLRPVPSENALFCTCVFGRPVLSERMYGVAEALGMPLDTVKAEVGATSGAADPAARVELTRALRHPWICARGIAMGLTIEGRVRRLSRRGRRLEERLSRLDPAALSIQSGASRVQEPGIRFVQHAAFLATCVVANLIWRQGEALSLLRRLPRGKSTLAHLLAEGDGSATARQLDDLLSVAATVREAAGGVDFVTQVRPEHASLEAWRSHLPPQAWTRVEAWLTRYGHRGPLESDLANPRYGEDPRLLAAVLFPLVHEGPAETAVERRRRRVAEAKAAWEEVRTHLGWPARLRLRRRVRQIQRLLSFREALRDRLMGVTSVLRTFLLELGSRLAARGQLDAAEHVWHLKAEEVERAMASPRASLSATVVRERNRRAAWRRIRVPAQFTSEQVPGFSRTAWSDGGDARVLRGTPVSPGVARGRVCVLDSVSQGGAMESGAILVAPAADPAWTPLFVRAAAVIVELGGTLSHASIVAREYGVPYVADVHDATRVLRTGDRVFVDGGCGDVVVLSSSGAT